MAGRVRVRMSTAGSLQEREAELRFQKEVRNKYDKLREKRERHLTTCATRRQEGPRRVRCPTGAELWAATITQNAKLGSKHFVWVMVVRCGE